MNRQPDDNQKQSTNQPPDHEKVQQAVENVTENVSENVKKEVEHVQQEVQRSHEPWYRISRKAQALILVYGVLFALFAVMALFVHYHTILPADVAISQEVQEEEDPWLRTTMLAVSWLGTQNILFAILILLTGAAFWVVNLRLEGVFIVVQSLVTFICTTVLKIIVNRPRPSAPLVEVIQAASGHSFPSGHVMSYVAYWGLLFSLGIILFKRDRWWTYLILIVPAFFVGTVGISRIYLGDHWASDVLGAYLLGGILLSLGLLIYLSLKRRHVLEHDLWWRRPSQA